MIRGRIGEEEGVDTGADRSRPIENERARAHIVGAVRRERQQRRRGRVFALDTDAQRVVRARPRQIAEDVAPIEVAEIRHGGLILITAAVV